MNEDIATAFNSLTSNLVVTATERETHTHLCVEGIDSEVSRRAISVYLVGCIAYCVHTDMQIRQALFNDHSRLQDLIGDVVAVIGAVNPPPGDSYRNMKRDPWICEALSHLFVQLGGASPGFHPSGSVVAKTLVKYDVNDHGLDLIALYDSGVLGITAGESKAYLADPGQAITDAAAKLAEVDKNLRDVEIRATMSQLYSALDSGRQARVAGAFWKTERTYIPFVCCDGASAIDWQRNRKVLRNLELPANRKYLVPFSLPNAATTLDSICDLARSYARNDLSLFGGPASV